MSIKLTIHGTGTGPCALSGKEGEGITVTFEDGTLRETFLSHRAFQQLLKMKLGQGNRPAAAVAPKPTAPATAPAQAVPATGVPNK